MSGYTYETEVELMPDWKDVEDPIVVTLALELECETYGQAPSGLSGPPEYADPGWGPEFDLVEARIELGNDDKGKPIGDIVLKPAQFDALFGKIADDTFESACEAAAETGEFG